MKKKNYELENEFNEWKDKEDQQLRELNYPEDKIATLRKYDHDLFVNKARSENGGAKEPIKRRNRAIESA